MQAAKQNVFTSAPSIETAPSYSPNGNQIVFESDRSGSQQLYVMSAGGGEARRISFGDGRYGTPVWSPRGDLIAFTKQSKGRFHIGVMRNDGSEERLLTASFLDEGPHMVLPMDVLLCSRVKLRELLVGQVFILWISRGVIFDLCEPLKVDLTRHGARYSNRLRFQKLSFCDIVKIG